MRYAKLSSIKFYSCSLQQCLSIKVFSYRIPGHGQKGHMNKVCQSFSLEVFLELDFSFFVELNMVLGMRMVLCMTGRYFENNLLPLK